MISYLVVIGGCFILVVVLSYFWGFKGNNDESDSDTDYRG
jgi:cbb3-type cytochrome oxidase subunit 3